MDCSEKILSDLYADLIVDFMPPADSGVLRGRRDYCYLPVGNFYLVYVNRAQTTPFSLGLYAYGNTPNIYGLMENEFDPSSLIASGITQIQRPPLSLTGRGVVMAFIDTGIDYTLDIFKDANGNTRILSIWDQTDQTGTPPEGYLFGSEYTREQIDEALQNSNPYSIVPSRDELQHGTSMAGVAAGSAIDGGRTYTGAAPESDIVVIKLKQCKPYMRDYYLIPEDVPAYAENDIMLAVKYAESFAVAFERPVVICMGVGTNQGNHAGNSPLARYLDEVATQRSRAVVVAGGNEGNAAHHFRGQLKTGQSDNSNYEDVEIRVGENTRGFFLELWGSVPDVFNIAIRSPGGETISPSRIRSGRSGGTYAFVYEQTKITIDSILVEQSTGEELIVMRFELPTPGIWNIRVIAQGEVYSGIFHIWLPIQQFMTGETYFLEPDPNITLTEPAYAFSVITVSTYNDLNNSFYLESGRGFSRTGEIKPDFAAPGVNISTIYGAMSGSSLAAAITSGAVAQFMQWAVVQGNKILVESVEIKSFFIRGASRDGNLVYPNPEWGYGRLNLVGTFNTMVEI